jgi:hypothetical protein
MLHAACCSSNIFQLLHTYATALPSQLPCRAFMRASAAAAIIARLDAASSVAGAAVLEPPSLLPAPIVVALEASLQRSAVQCKHSQAESSTQGSCSIMLCMIQQARQLAA